MPEANEQQQQGANPQQQQQQQPPSNNGHQQQQQQQPPANGNGGQQVGTGGWNQFAQPQTVQTVEPAAPQQPPQQQQPQQQGPQTQPQQQPAAPQGNGQQAPQEQIVQMPSKAFAQRLGEERDKAARRVYADLDAEAQSLGYSSFAELKQSAQRQGQQQQQQAGQTGGVQPQQQPGGEAAPGPQDEPTTGGESAEDLRRRVAQLQADKRRLAADRARQEKARRQAEQENARLQVRMNVREAAARQGVQDVDYAEELARRHIRSLPQEQLSQFDVNQYFSESMRQSHPYLFAARTEPATTGPAGNGSGQPEPAPQTPEAAQQNHVQQQQVDARQMPRDDYLQLLRKKGLQDPAVGT